MVVALLLASCGGQRHRLGTSGQGTLHYEAGVALERIWAQALSTRFVLDTNGQGSVDNLERLMRGEVAFALAQNDASVRSTSGAPYTQLRTVLPLYEQILFIVYRPVGPSPATLAELLQGKRVHLGPAGGGTAYLARRLFHAFGLDTTRFRLQHGPYHENVLSDTTDVSISVTSPYNPRVAAMLAAGGKLWSLDDPAHLGRGCAAEAFCQGYTMARPTILPRYRYPQLAEPVLTISVDNVLVTRADTDERMVYELVAQTLAHRRELMEASPLFNQLSETFATDRLHYPLHAGTEDYLRRHEPSFLARNAELISLLITLGSVVYGGLLIVAKRRANRVRRRIEQHYQAVLAIEDRIPTLDQPEAFTQALNALHQVRAQACAELARKELEADTAFRILLDLIDQAQEGIHARRQNLHIYSKPVD